VPESGRSAGAEVDPVTELSDVEASELVRSDLEFID
jgi:hypothetical protein